MANRIPINQEKLAQGSAGHPLLPSYWEDSSFHCVDCGETVLFSAEQKKEYYEVEQKLIYSKPRRCDRCRDEILRVKELKHRMDEALCRAKHSTDIIAIDAAIHALVAYHDKTKAGSLKRLRELLKNRPSKHVNTPTTKRARGLVAGKAFKHS